MASRSRIVMSALVETPETPALLPNLNDLKPSAVNPAALMAAPRPQQYRQNLQRDGTAVDNPVRLIQKLSQSEQGGTVKVSV